MICFFRSLIHSVVDNLETAAHGIGHVMGNLSKFSLNNIHDNNNNNS